MQIANKNYALMDLLPSLPSIIIAKNVEDTTLGGLQSIAISKNLFTSHAVITFPAEARHIAEIPCVGSGPASVQGWWLFNTDFVRRSKEVPLL